MLFFQQKNVSFVFLSLALIHVALFLVELRRPAAHFLFSLSVFVFIDSFVVSALQDAGGYEISRQNNLELHLGCRTC